MDFDTLTGQVLPVSGRVPRKCRDDGVIVVVGCSDWSLQAGTVWGCRVSGRHSRRTSCMEVAAREMSSYSAKVLLMPSLQWAGVLRNVVPHFVAFGCKIAFAVGVRWDDERDDVVELDPRMLHRADFCRIVGEKIGFTDL